jgi:hypothetical protein
MMYPIAFTLLTQVARRALRTGQQFNPHNLKVGQALLGDHQSIGATQQEYRTAKSQLESWGFATFEGTNRGTIATLTDTKVYDINIEEINDPGNELNNSPTTFQATTPATTKEEVKKLRTKEEKEKKNTRTPSVERLIPAGYCENARKVIESWHEIAVAGGLGFLPIEQYSANVDLFLRDSQESDLDYWRQIFRFLVDQESKSPTQYSKSLRRVIEESPQCTGILSGFPDWKKEDDEIPF